jgi:uncharacterized protein YndB with AHSA1/START domain
MTTDKTDFVAKASVSIARPVADVWRALVDPAVIARYMFGATVVSTWKRGDPIFWKGEWNGTPFQDKGTILRFEPERLLSYSHFSPLSGRADTPENYHTVTIELSTVDGVTRVELSQDNNPTVEARAHSEDNWTAMLKGLKKTAEG